MSSGVTIAGCIYTLLISSCYINYKTELNIKIMYKQQRAARTTIKRNTSYIGETIEQKVARIVNNKEPIKDGAPLIYTERKDGVQPSYNIRTDRFEIAVDAMDKVAKTHLARREERGKVVPMDKKKEGDSGAEPIQGTGGENQ